MSSTTSTPAPVIDDPAERKSRQLAFAQEMQHLSMTLIRRTAAKAEQALDQQHPNPEDPPQRTPDHILGFVRLSRVMHHLMTFETRVANDDLVRRPRHHRLQAATQDRRRPLLRDALHRAANDLPAADRAQRRREVDDRIEAELVADPNQQVPIAELLAIIAQAADLPIDPKNLSDELLGMETQTPTPYLPARRKNL